MAKTLRRPPVRGSQDPDLPGHVLVPIRKDVKGFPKVNYSVPDTSYWRVNQRNNKPVAIVTLAPTGLRLGWDTCGSCGMGFNGCNCYMGISLPNAIGYIFVQAGGKKPLPLPNAVRFQQPESPAPTLKKLSRPAAKVVNETAPTPMKMLKRKPVPVMPTPYKKLNRS